MRKHKIVQIFLCFIISLLSVGCDKEEATTSSLKLDIDSENSSIEGSFVQNTKLSAINVFNLRYIGEASSAKVSAKEVNGIYINETQVELTKSGSIKIPIAGKPIELGDYTLKIELETGGKKYYCSQIFTVYEDTDPNAPITLTIDDQYKNINGLTEPLEIPFTVDPTMASLTVDTVPNGLNVKSVVDKRTGEGILTLTPNDHLLGGKLKFTISFGARQPITYIMNVSPFVKGDGIDTPYEINSVALLKKMQYLLSSKFMLTADIDMSDVSWQPLGTLEKPFTGTLDGNGKTISNINITGTSNIALFAYTGASAEISNLTISGSVTGTEYVAGLVAINAGKITNCNAANVSVTGENYLSAIAAKTSGTITSSTPTEILKFTDFPAMIADIMAPTSKTLNIVPASAIITIEKTPEKATASINGHILTITPNAGFNKTDMSIKATYGKLSSVLKTIALFSEEQFDSGDGSAANPFTISKASQFNKIRDYSDKSFLLTANIDLSTLSPAWVPIPTFSGTIDGGNHQISKLTSGTAKGGLIVLNTGNIKNLSFPDVNITTAIPFGILVGDHNTGTIDNIVINGKVTSTNTSDLLGGVAAEISGGQISNVYASIEMNATCGMVGGIVGRAKTAASTISNCTTEGSITLTASKTRIAGIVGRGESAVVIKNCLSTMNITAAVSGVGTNGVGGIFGANNNNNMRIDECMFTGKINNVFMAGGIAGVAANIRNCLVEGSGATVSSAMLTVGGTINTSSAGGICGTGKGTVGNCIVRNIALTGVSSAALPISGISSTFQNEGFVSNCVVSNILINASNIHGIAGTAGNGTGVNSNNYSSGVLYYENGAPGTYSPTNSPSGLDGGSKTSAELTQSFYESLGYNFTTVWSWDGSKPVLRNVGYKGSVTKTLRIRR